MQQSDVLGLVVCIGVGISCCAIASNGIDSSKQEAICQQNLRLLMAGVNQYATENRGFLPEAVIVEKPKWTWWYGRLQPYVDDPAAFYCPTKSPEEWVEGGYRDPLEPDVFKVQNLAFGMNWILSEKYGKQAWRQSDVASPGELIVLGDANDFLMRATKFMWKKDSSTRHEGKANFAFLDGSVRLENPHPDKYVNDKAKGILARRHWRP